MTVNHLSRFHIPAYIGLLGERTRVSGVQILKGLWLVESVPAIHTEPVMCGYSSLLKNHSQVVQFFGQTHGLLRGCQMAFVVFTFTNWPAKAQDRPSFVHAGAVGQLIICYLMLCCTCLPVFPLLLKHILYKQRYIVSPSSDKCTYCKVLSKKYLLNVSM